LLASGKAWINLRNLILHNVSEAREINLEQTYQFFLKNVDFIEGKQADLGDLLDFDKSLNDNDPKETIAILISMVSQLILDLEGQGVIDKDDALRRFLLKQFVEGFTNDSLPEEMIPGLVPVEEVIFKKVNIKSKKTLMHDYFVYERKRLNPGFESLVNDTFRSYALTLSAKDKY